MTGSVRRRKDRKVYKKGEGGKKEIKGRKRNEKGGGVNGKERGRGIYRSNGDRMEEKELNKGRHKHRNTLHDYSTVK